MLGVSRFVTRREAEPSPESPEALFSTLQPTDRDVRHLWAHQADLLRDYHKSSASDIALELPTGAGKTLVGLLIAEFRRRANGSRTAYLSRRSSLPSRSPLMRRATASTR